VGDGFVGVLRMNMNVGVTEGTSLGVVVINRVEVGIEVGVSILTEAV
jgi:hypothetical protein